MSLQIFLQGKILGIEEFLAQAADDLEARAQWAMLLSEVLPRALLAELGLSRMLLGSSGGDQFLLVLPMEARQQAEEFFTRAASSLQTRTGGAVLLRYAVTENLGDWSDIRKRLEEEMHRATGAPARGVGADWFQPFVASELSSFGDFALRLAEAKEIGWSPEEPAAIAIDSGKHRWGQDVIRWTRHIALADDGSPATLELLASRATGRKTWGVLRADVDAVGVRLRRAADADEHLRLSMMYKQFFAGELHGVCSLPEFWQRVTVLYSGPADFVVYGAWDALIGLAREMQRLFALFVDANLREFTGAEGKTISMAISLAGQAGSTLSELYADAGESLKATKALARDSIYVLGRTLEWKQLGDAADTRGTMTRLISEFGASRQLLDELAAFYRDAPDAVVARRNNARLDRPWRFYRRLNTELGTSRSKEFQRLRADLISDFTGRRASNVLLRPQGRVALEWAKLETEVA